jgi:hypothetical protein
MPSGGVQPSHPHQSAGASLRVSKAPPGDSQLCAVMASVSGPERSRHCCQPGGDSQPENLAGLARISRDLIAKAEVIDSAHRVVLNMDSTEVPVYGRQEQSAYNGHFESTCYHPLLLFNRESDCLAAKLRPGNVHSAEGWEELLLPEIERQQQHGKVVVFRADAAFAKPEMYEALEQRQVKYVIRLPANDNLERKVAQLLKRPVGRPRRSTTSAFPNKGLRKGSRDYA